MPQLPDQGEGKDQPLKPYHLAHITPSASLSQLRRHANLCQEPVRQFRP